MKKRNYLLVLLCLVLTISTGCVGLGPTRPKVFETVGLTIELTTDFGEDIFNESFLTTFQSEDEIVTVTKDEYENIDNVDGLTLEEYLRDIQKMNGMEAEITDYNGIPMFIYDRTVGEIPYTYLAAGYTGTEGYWIVTFACKSENFGERKPVFLDFASSVQVN